MYKYRKIKTMMLLLLACVAAKAQLEGGKVYNFVNVAKGTSMTSTSKNGAAVSTTDVTDYSQLWYAQSSGNGFTLRNLGNGFYLYSPNATSNGWTLKKTGTEANNVFSVSTVNGNSVVRVTANTGSYNYMHADGSGNIVCWESNNTASQWTINVVSISEDVLNANWDKLDEIATAETMKDSYQEALDNLFTDRACTTLKKTFTSDAEVEADEDYKKLPSTLQNMVMKVYKGDWAEENCDKNLAGWDSDYAKKYRVQFYEPYNEPVNGSTALGLNWHTNMNNPTGIFANMQEVLYVMVEGEIKDGAYLYLASYKGHSRLGSYDEGVQLHEGLNIVPSYEMGKNFCVNYVVETFDVSDGKRGNKAKARPLSGFPDLKIHIEGGYINGYWNKMGDYRQTGNDVLYAPDKNADWDYIAARATQTDVTVLGEYITLQFPLHTTQNSEGGDENGLGYYYTGKNIIESSIQEWDNVMMWERLLLGVLSKEVTENTTKNPKSPYSDGPNVVAYTGEEEDGYESGYGDYYNVHGLSFGVPSGYMYGSGDHCGYHFNTMSSIMVDILTSADSHWGPAHEIGHQHQGLLNMRGLTEVTNNLFSNVVYWYFGETTSRVNGTEGTLSSVFETYNTEGSDFFSNNIWAQTHMYYKLFLYYHVLGHNPKFYPRLFEMLRQDPMIIGYNQSGAESLLHFYKKCCYAAGEDLTEFFRAYGFFRVMTDRFVGDYSNAVYNQTQTQIDGAIAEVKTWAAENNAKENISVLFVNDATGEEIQSHKGDVLTLFESSATAELGSYASFSTAETSDYTYTVTGNTVTMTGAGGVGFVIRNAAGEIVAFSDKATFEISTEAAELIASGEATFEVTNSDNTASDPVDIMASDNTSAKYAALGELLEAAQAIVDLADESGTKLGYYRQDAIADLITAYNKAKPVYDDKTVLSYSAVYDVLSREYLDVMGNEFARIGLVEGNAYRFTNKQYTERSMSVPTDSTNRQVMGEITDTESPYDQQLWYFEKSGTDGSYYLKNKDEGTYLGDVKTSTYIYATATETSDAYAYKLKDKGNGLWSFVGSGTALHMGAANYKYGVLGWGDDAAASQWYITSVESDQNAEALYNLQALIAKTEDLIGDMADVVPEQKLVLQDSFPTNPNYLSTNADHNAITGESDGQGLNGLLDDATDTYFHSEYRNNVTTTHYLQVDLGNGNEMKTFKFNYTTRNNGDNCPTAIVVAGSTDGSSFTDIATFDSGLPTGSAESWESPLIDGAGYRHLRFSVTATEDGMKYFVMSTFGITDMTASVKSIDDVYTTGGLTTETLVDAYTTIHEARDLVASNNATEQSLSSKYSALEGKYNALLTIYQNAQTTALSTAKAELQTWITNTANLLAECGTVTYTPAVADTEITGLQTTNENGDYYVWTNAQSTQEKTNDNPDKGYIKNLVDGDNTSYFHSDYSGANSTDSLDHHITINLGESNAVSTFKFKYVTRDATYHFPSEIEVYGSTDNVTYDLLETISSGLPLTGLTEYTSPIIEGDKPYAYLRIMVTKNKDGSTKGGHQYFHMADLDLYAGTPAHYSATKNTGDGTVTDSLMIASAIEKDDAQAIYDNATSADLIELETKKLQAAYQALYDAHNNVTYVDDRSSLNTLITNTQALLDACYNTDDTYTGSLYLTAELKTTTATEIDAAKAVYAQSKVTENEYNAALAALQTAYDNLAAAQVTADKANELQALIDETSALLDICGTISTAPATTLDGAVSLQTTNDDEPFYLSTNAQESSEGPISGLTDNNSETFFHSSWNKSIGASHYLQVDMGEQYGLKEFAFGYTTRNNGGGGPHPSVIEISGSNSTDNDSFVTFATISEGLPTGGGTAWTTTDNIIIPGMPYRYLRFTVTLSAGSNGCKHSDDEYFFTMSEFGITAVPTEESYYAEVDVNAGSVTEELMVATKLEQDEAEALLATATTGDALTTAKSELQARYDSLKQAYDTKILPVIVTTDPEEPVLYTLNLPYRDRGAKRLQYEPASNHLISVADSVQGSAKQAFYFMPGNERTQVYILPYAAGEQVLAASNTGDGADKVSAAKKGELKYEQWQFVSLGDTCYNIQPVGTSTYFSNINGTSYKMGFYSRDNTTDNGSRFTFTRTAVEGSGAYNSLKIYYDEATKVASSSITGGDQPGYYPVEEAEAYNTAYAKATVLCEATMDSAAYSDYLTAYEKFLTANEALEIIMPEVGKYYVIRSAYTGYANKLMYATGENAMEWDKNNVKTEASPEALWTFTSEGYLENLQTGCAVNTASSWSAAHKLGDDPKVVSVKSISLDGQVLLTPAGSEPLHADQHGPVVGWHTYDAGSASAWRIVEVEDMSLVKFALTMTQYEHAGLYLNYPVTIPEGVKAYIIDGTDIDINADGVGTLKLTKLEGSVLPEKTATILYAAEGNYEFFYTNEEATDEVSGNLLTGSTYVTYKEAESDHKYYVFGQNNGEVGLYKNGVKYDEAGAEGTTHYKMSANKVLFDWNDSAQPVNSFRFRFNSGTTGIENIVVKSNAIYDLYGRRILEVKSSGLYIVDGEKRYIQVK